MFTNLPVSFVQVMVGVGLPVRSVPHTRVADSPSRTGTLTDPAPPSPAPTELITNSNHMFLADTHRGH